MKGKIYFWLITLYLIVVIVYVTGIFQAIEEWGLSHRFYVQYLFNEGVDTPIVLVGIDEKSLAKIGRWPWSRTYHETLLMELKAAGAKVIGLDLIFDQPHDADIDNRLAMAMKKSNVVLPVTLDLEMYRGLFGEEVRVKEVQRPMDMFASVTQMGHINLIPDADGVVRRSFPELDGVASFSLKLARLYAPEKSYRRDPFWIHYEGPAMSFPIYSYLDVLQGRYPVEAFRDKVVLVGAMDAALGDQFVTPLSQAGLMSGMEVHAHQLQTLLTGKYVLPLKKYFGLIFITLTALLCGYITSHWKPLVKIYTFILFGFGYYIFSHYAFIKYSVVWPYVPFMLISVSYLIIGMLYSYFLRDAEHHRLYQALHRYLAPQVLNQVLARSEEVKLGGELRDAAVVFIDIRGFTAYTHAHRPEEVVELLNQYLKLFADVVFAYEGTLDKYLGDGLMAVFGAPVKGEDDLKRAFNAALEIRARVLREGLPLPVGIGLAYGSVVSGNIGSEKRMDYTVVGNTVNTASRLEGLAGPGELVMTENVVQQLEIIDHVEINEVQVRGLNDLTKVYRLR